MEVLMANADLAVELGLEYMEDPHCGIFASVSSMEVLMQLFTLASMKYGWFKVTALTSELIAIQ